MGDNRSIVPHMDWQSANTAEAFKLFKQRCQLFFRVKNIASESQVDHILLLAGEEGLRRFNSWSLSDEDAQKPDIIWDKFTAQIEPASNYRVARLYLQRFRQLEGESVDDFISRMRLQAQKCDFRDSTGTDSRLFEQLIAGICHRDLQKELLGKPKETTLEQAIEVCRLYEASVTHMAQYTEAQAPTTQVSAIQRAQSKRPQQTRCKNCGGDHARQPREACPAYGTECHKCRKPNHWSNVCMSNSQANPSQNQRGRRRSKNRQRGSWRRSASNNRDIHAIQAPGPAGADDMNSQFESLSFAELVVCSLKSERTEVYADVNIQLQSRPGTHTLKAKVDTGAQGNTIPLRMYRRMCPQDLNADGLPKANALKHIDTVLTAYNGTRITQYGTISIACQYAESDWITSDFFVVDTDGPAILGLPSLQALELVTLHCAITTTGTGAQPAGQGVRDTADLKARFPQRFDRIGDFKEPYHITRDPDAPSTIHGQRPCPIQMKDEVKQELDNMEQLGVIRKVTEPTDWVNSIAYSRKKDGRLRICLDPKDLNKAIKRCHYRTPTVDEIRHKLTGAKHFSKLDAKHGYWSIHLDEESQLLTTFNTPFGRYCYTRMPFGLVMSQDVFQYRMDQILENCPGTVNIADDVIVYGATEEEHDTHLLNLMAVAGEHGLTFNSDKCLIKTDTIPFFGEEYSAQGVRPDPEKVADIQSIPAPSSKDELHRFIGIATYMGSYLPHLSQQLAPLRDMLKEDIEFQWTASHQARYDDVKKQIAKCTTLAYYNPSLESVIQVDASSRGLGAVLLQEGRPIAFASKALTATEQRYANIEREMLAVVFGCERFHMYVYGRSFTVISDHKPLEMICLKNLTAAPPRLQRMLLKVQGYDFVIKYKPGKELLLADGLSRLPVSSSPEIELDTKICFVQFSPRKLSKLQAETSKDVTLSALHETISTGWPETRRDIARPLRPYWGLRDELSVEDGLIMKGDRIIIPASMRKEILEAIHAGHQGAEKCKLRARTCVYWPQMNSDIDEVTRECPTCQTYRKSQRPETLMPHEVATRPWEVIGTDLLTLHGYDHLLVCDYYSKYPIVRRIPLGQSTSPTIVGMLKQIFAEHGIPERIVSDNGRVYDSACFRNFTEAWNIEHVTSSPRFPQSNGLAERFVDTVKNALIKAKHSHFDPDMALLCLRTTPIDNTLPSPGELLMGRKLRGNLPIRVHNTDPARDTIRDRLEERRDSQKTYHDRTARDLPPLVPGQAVRIQDPVSGQWNPAQVVQRSGEQRSYIIETPNGSILRRNRRHLQDIQPAEKRVHFSERLAENTGPDAAVTPPDPPPAPTPEEQRPYSPYKTRSGRVIVPPSRPDMWTHICVVKCISNACTLVINKWITLYCHPCRFMQLWTLRC